MVVVKNKERTIDGIAVEGRIALGHPKTREAMRAGLAMYFETLDDPGLMETARKIVDELDLDHFFNIQLVGEHVQHARRGQVADRRHRRPAAVERVLGQVQAARERVEHLRAAGVRDPGVWQATADRASGPTTGGGEPERGGPPPGTT